MPRYFFNRINGSSHDLDREGVELPGQAEARYEAVAFAADSLKHHGFQMWDGGNMRIEVVDIDGVLLFSVLISVVDETKSPEK